MSEVMRAHGFREAHTLEADMAAGLYPHQRECNCGRQRQDKVHQDADANRRDLDMRIRAANLRPRNAARIILGSIPKHADPVVRATLETAVSDLIDEVDHWKDSWAAVTVDRDHKVREAMARSESCSAHGEEIRELKNQILYLDRDRERVEQARLVLLGWYQACVNFTTGYMGQGAAIRPSSKTVVDWMTKQLAKVHNAHHKVFAASITTEPTKSKTTAREGT